jgi:xylose dehydrogenase (NAD/NADP)
MDVEHYFEVYERRDWDTGATGEVRLAVVGLGGFARNVVLPALTDADYVRPTVVVSGTPDVADAVAGEYDATPLDYEEYAAGEAVAEYDAVYVATPNRLHLPHVETAAEHGKDVICEKPLEATLERTERLVAACEDAGVVLMTAYRMQADPVVRRLRAFVRAGGLGEPLQGHGAFAFPVVNSRGADHWRFDDHLAGGGALMDVGVYPLNTTRFVLDADPVAVSGTTRGEGVLADVDGHVAFTCEFEGGATGSYTASFDGQADSRFSIRGTEGRVEVTNAFGAGGARRVTVRRGDASVEVAPVATNEATEEFDYFAHALLTDGAVEPDGRDGLTDVRAMAAVYESAERGARVELDG